MQRNTTFFTSVAITVALVLGTPLSASASPAPSIDDAVSAVLEADLQQIAEDSGGTVLFSDVRVDVSPELIAAVGSTDANEIVEYIIGEAEAANVDASTAASQPSTPVASAPFATQAAAKKTVSYTADQSTVLPAFGVAWVNQDMNVTFTGNKINSVKLSGNSYGTGISLFAYSHIKTTLTYRKSNTCLYTDMKGTFSAIVKGSSVAFAATVRAADGPRNGKMVSINVNDC